MKSLAIETKIGECPFCSARHDIEEYDELIKLPVKEKSKVFFQKKLCMVCYVICYRSQFQDLHTKKKNAEIVMENIQEYCMVCN